MPVGENGAWGSNISRFFDESQQQQCNAVLDAHEGDLLLFVADRPTVAPGAIGALRLHLASHFALVPPGRHDVLWVVDFPMFAYDEAERRYDPLHHPFTAPSMPGDADAPLDFTAPGALRSRAYDLVTDGWELGGGSIRIHDREVQQQVLAAIGIGPEEAQARFGFLLDALRYGAPPHGGIAMGIDRIVAIMLGHESIREVIAFPKTASGGDPLTGAPAPVDEGQLRELGLRSVAPAAAPAV
jgi:aspartyl-tRNA synthetase